MVRGRPSDYRTQHPVPAQIGMIGEVADSSLAHDRNVKGPLYAQAGIPVYWVINVVDNILVYGDNQTVFYKSGDPVIWDRGRELGMTNRIDRVPA